MLQGVAREVTAAGGEAIVCPCDVVDSEAVEAIVARISEQFGPIDIAIANAGVGSAMGVPDLSFETMRHVMDVNYLGTATLLAAVVPRMVARGSGQIAAVSSIASYRGLLRSGPYCASKAAVSTLLESLRLELAPLGIGVTAIHPGFIKTPMTDKNKFPMPFMVPVERAAKIIARGLLKGRREINFPWQMVLAVKLLRLLPGWLFDAAMSRKPR
jgi:short-subunit dehydrogenase